MTSALYRDQWADGIDQWRQFVGRRVKSNKSGQEFAVKAVEVGGPPGVALTMVELEGGGVMPFGAFRKHFTILDWPGGYGDGAAR